MDLMVSDEAIDTTISEILAEAQWDPEKYTVSDFLQKFTSAQPIRIVSRGSDLDLSPADTLHPFLAFSRRRRTKVYAENLVWDDQSQKYEAKGPILEIPKDYLGWFEVTGKGWKHDHSCHTCIADIAKVKCKQFLVKTTLIGHLSADNNNTKDGGDPGDFQVGSEIRIFPGDLLSVGDVITKKWKMQSVLDKKAKGPSTKFLQCIDTQQRLVYLPFGHPGEFYPLWDSQVKSKTPSKDHAYYIYDLLGFGFPLLVNVVFGWPPADYPEFSGFLRLLGVGRPDTLVVRNLKHGSCVIVELPLECDAKIEQIANMEILTHDKHFETLLSHSCDRIYPYLIGMKHMDRYFPICHPREDADNAENESRDANSSPSHGKVKDKARMARPRNMLKFDIMDIFPPLKEPIRQVADSWTLSFKDPSFAAHSEMKEAESVIVDPQNDNNVLSSDMKGMKVSDVPLQRRHEIWQKRAQMQKEIIEREADC